METITLKEYELQKDAFANVLVVMRYAAHLCAESYTAEGEKIGVMCGCGGSGYMCQPCLKLILHEAEFQTHHAPSIYLA